MTVQNENYRDSFQGNGVATLFTFTFLVTAASEVAVIRRDAYGVDTVLTQGVDYSVAGVGDPAGGTVTYPLSGSPLPSGEYLFIVRSMSFTQLLDLMAQGKWDPDEVERALDRIVMQNLQMKEALSRAILYKRDPTEATPAEFPLPQPGTIIGYDAEGKPTNLTTGATGLNILTDLATFLTGKGTDLLAWTGHSPTTATGALNAHESEIVAGRGGTANLNARFTPLEAASKKALVSADDTTPGHLNGKLAAGAGITMTEGSPGGNETLTIAAAVRGHIDGMTLANNSSDLTNDIDFKAGQCIDSSNLFLMGLASTMVKRIDAVWAAGSAAGGRASNTNLTGAKWFHCFAIAKPDGTTDCGFDTSVTAAGLLADAAGAGYTKYRRLGSIYWTGTTISAFRQYGDYFTWLTPVQSQASTPVSTSAANITVRVPAVTVVALMGIYIHSGGGHDLYGLITSPLGDNGGSTPSATTANLHAYAAAGIYDQDVHREIRVPTANSVIVSRFNATGTSTYLVYTEGWLDQRGKDA